MKHSFKVRQRAFVIWQKLGYNPWARPKESARSRKGDFYKGAFDSIPFLNDDAKRTFQHLLLRPGYMIRDYIHGQHERYLAPFTALIIFYAFFALVSSVLSPVQQQKEDFSDISVTADMDGGRGEEIAANMAKIVGQGYIYLHLDQHSEVVDTRAETALAALEGTLRSQGIPLFLGEFFFLWFAMAIALRRLKLGLSACAAASAYVLCQFSFFMLFAVLVTLGKSTSIGVMLMMALLAIDYRQWLGLPWKKAIGRTVVTGVWYGLMYLALLILVSLIVVTLAYIKG